MDGASADAAAAAASPATGADAAAASASPPAAAEAAGFVHVVVQRCLRARLLVDAAADAWTEIGRGLVIYVSFSKAGERAAEAAAQQALRKAARSLLSAPLASPGEWQADHGDADSVVALCRRGEQQDLLVVPQASLVAKLELGERNVKYHQQCGREAAGRLYHGFVEALGAAARELVAGPGPRHDPDAYQALRARRAEASQIPPDQLFHTGEYEGKYSAFDARGVPTHGADGAELPKNALKKLEKSYATQVKKYAKAGAVAENRAEDAAPSDPTTSPAASQMAEPTQASGARPPAEEAESKPEPPLCLPEGACLPEVRHGTFGGRQGFELTSAGPFTHMFVF